MPVQKNALYSIDTDPDCEWAQTIPIRRRTIDDGSAAALYQARRWLKACNENHACIAVDENLEMPTRVLAINQERGLISRLMDEPNQRGRYIALSHCWGKSHRITLTKATESRLKEGILTANLPKTFRDAVKIAKDLRVQYLWIDSLCIMQDDPVDWENEAAKMAGYYANAYLTVSATSSVDDDFGCFTPRNSRVNVENVSIESQTLASFPAVLPAMLEYPPGGDTKVTLSDRKVVEIMKARDNLCITREWLPPSMKGNPRPFVIGAFGELFDPLENEPLSKRGWCLQERLLSRRVLHYATSQMFWECTHGILSEDGCFFPRVKDGTTVLPGIGRLTTAAFRTITPYGHKRFETPLLLSGFESISWREMIAEYSQRNLTVEQDKLSAVAGLARRYAAKTGDQYYVAGLWRSSLGSDLLWRVYSREEIVTRTCSEHSEGPGYGKKLSTVKVPATYCAPSWSWASISAGVVFQPHDPAQQLFSTITGRMMFSQPDLFGRVGDGYLMLQVKC